MPQTPRRPLPTRIDPYDEAGQTLSEYSVLVAFIAIVVVAALPNVASAIMGLFGQVTAFFGG